MAEGRLRIDKWLWFARLAKTRTLAQKLVASGRVRINRQKNDNAAHPVRIGDVLTIAVGGHVRVLRVAALGTRRGPPAEALHLYEDLTPALGSATPVGQRSGKGRPTKRERRDVDKLRSNLTVPDEDFPP
jgi:ribosome-associated heat shock protein Hsp15